MTKSVTRFGKTYNFPDDATSEEIDAFVANDRGKAPKASKHKDTGEILADSAKGVGRSVAQGLGFGFGDEAIAGVRSLIEDRSYDDLAAEEHKAFKNFEDKNPIISGAANLAGSVATLPVTGPIGGTLTSLKGLRALRTAPRMVRYGAAGASQGALAGAGSAQGDLEDRAIGAGVGATVGGTMGAAIPEAGHQISRLYNYLKGRAWPATQDAVGGALDALSKGFTRDKLTPDLLRDRARLDEKYGVPSKLMDYGSNLTGQAEAVVAKPGQGSADLIAAIKDRQSGQHKRIYGRVNKALKPDDYFEADAAYLKRLSGNADKLFTEAREEGQSLMSPKLSKLLDMPQAKEAGRMARRLASMDPDRQAPIDPKLLAWAKEAVNDGKLPAEVLDDGVASGVSTAFLHDLKKGLDGMIAAQPRNPTTGGLNPEATLLTNYKKQLVKELQTLNPKYGKAMETYKGDAEVMDALHSGHKEFFKLQPEEIAEFMSTASAAEKEAFQTGSSRAILERLRKLADTGDAAKKLGAEGLGSEDMRLRLEPLFNKPSEYNLFMAAMKREGEIFENGRRVLGGSPTARRGEGIKDLDKPEFAPENMVVDLASAALVPTKYNLLRATGNIGSTVLKAIQNPELIGLTERKADQLAKFLNTGSRKDVEALITKMEQRMAEVESKHVAMVDKGIKEAGPLGQQITSKIMSPGEEIEPD